MTSTSPTTNSKQATEADMIVNGAAIIAAIEKGELRLSDESVEDDMNLDDAAILAAIKKGELRPTAALEIEPVSKPEEQDGSDGEEQHELLAGGPKMSDFIRARNCSNTDIIFYVSQTCPTRYLTGGNVTAGPAAGGFGVVTTLWAGEPLVKRLNCNPAHKPHEVGHKPSDRNPSQCPEANFLWKDRDKAFISVTPGGEAWIVKNEQVKRGYLVEFHGDCNLTIYDKRGSNVSAPAYQIQAKK
ncbi:hypothetical protein H2200_003532 [Cladophialophora chaetospira]|uniref:Uncharacterized protein n=1 Tax=Cladophialophora chaetospira TaxID=386627 RepID=A0AA38XHJ4_9EURO|nr:hypothetical protein H2200_003532 [Cladophialophora chaetospira]